MRKVIHSIVAVLLWGVFLYYWQIVAQRPINPDTRTAMLSLGALSFFSVVYLSAWVFHNIRISRKFKRRRVRHHEKKRPLHDFLGRWIVVDHPEKLLSANYIEVEIKSSIVRNKTVEEKIFRTSPRISGR